jgi:hypothetical protein
MTATATPTHVVGDRTELARYTLPDGTTRVVAGQRIDGTVILIDHPAGDEGRVYLIERGLEQDGNAAMRSLLNDYLLTADRLGTIPAAGIPLERWLENLP